MRRALLILLGIAAITWFQFAVFPGHTWLQADTQIYVPALQRLDAPGFLSRDLVATHPNLTYTIYDEVTLFLHEAGKMDLKAALVLQQVLFRAAAVLGAFLLVRSTGLPDMLALLTAGLVNFGATLYGLSIQLIDREPTPLAFALGLIVLAAGLLARGMPLMAGFAGGLALVYDPQAAFPFWVVVLLAMCFDRRLRRLIRPSITVLAVFGLLLANLAQLQPGTAATEGLFNKVRPQIEDILHYRTDSIWVSSWAPREIWMYLALWICGLWAITRIWVLLNAQLRWLMIALPFLGMLSVPFSYMLLEGEHFYVVPRLQPARSLMFTMAFSLFACAIAGVHAARNRRFVPAGFLLALVISISLTGLRNPLDSSGKDMNQIADWAQENTWGGSMFLFPDAGKERYPGVFRAEARRAVWVDWETGKQADYFDSFAEEWSRRWRDTMEGRFSPDRLKEVLLLPIDYCVLKKKDALSGTQAVFASPDFLVYDARVLRSSTSVGAGL